MRVAVYSIIFFMSYIISNWASLEAFYDKFKGRRILLEIIVVVASLITAATVTYVLYILISIICS